MTVKAIIAICDVTSTSENFNITSISGGAKFKVHSTSDVARGLQFSIKGYVNKI